MDGLPGWHMGGGSGVEEGEGSISGFHQALTLLRLVSEIYPAGSFCPRVEGTRESLVAASQNLRARQPSVQEQDDAKLHHSRAMDPCRE